MTETAPGTMSEVDGFRHMARLTDIVLHANVAGVSQEESLAQPRPGGNCLNWVVGHLVCIGNNALPVFGQEPVVEPGSLSRYDRGSAPITNPADAMDIGELMRIWDQIVPRVDAGLSTLRGEAMARPAPFSPSGDPDETVGSLVATVIFHQTYHAGQTGVLRRVAGKEGVIK